MNIQEKAELEFAYITGHVERKSKKAQNSLIIRARFDNWDIAEIVINWLLEDDIWVECKSVGSGLYLLKLQWENY